MPTITIHKRDLDNLVGKKLSLANLEASLSWVKGELKDYNAESDEAKIELNDSNRPDLWCTEGIARQIRLMLKGKADRYSFYRNRTGGRNFKISVDRELKQIRPFIAAFAVSDYLMSEAGLIQFIQTQEKLAEIFGHKRKLLSIGIYPLDGVTFPLYYKAVPPDQYRFVPLGSTEEMSLSGILENHPKGKQYGEIFENREFLPLFVDQKGKVLSFPPIINSREAGEVHPGDRELMVEVTGTDLRLVNLVLNILATNFFDRGGRVEPVTVSYPYQTVLGKRVLFPCTVDSPMIVDLKEISKILGESLKPVEVSRALESYGHTVTRMTGDKFKVSTSPYRDDILHPVDLIEDVAMSIGYENFKPELPKDFSRGSLSGEEKFSDKIRDYFVGAGFQEMISNILTSREDLVDKMRLDYHNLPLVEIDNVMTAQFSIVRNQILPSLLRVESSSGKSFYPHHIFEIGEIAEKNISMNIGSKTRIHLAALTSHMNASFSEMHSCLDLFFYYFIGKEGRTYELKATDHPSYIPGRHGEIYLKIEGRGGKEIRIGEIGEIHPEVLDRWQIGVPCSALILDVESLLPFSFSFS